MRHRLIAALATLCIAAAALFIWSARHTADLPSAGVAQTAAAGELSVTLWLDAAALGPRVAEVRLRDAAGQLAAARAVRLRFTMAEMAMDPAEADAPALGPGRHQARGSFFAMAGLWDVAVVIQRDGQPDLSVAFALPVAAPGEASGPISPLPGDAATLAAGRQIYTDSCAQCHGPAGRGDGPLAAGLSPRPADLTQHMAPGLHTDGQVFLWIQQGRPGTAMPAWGGRLTDQQIWQLVAHLRALWRQAGAPQATAAPAPAAPTASPAPAAEPLPALVFARQGNLWRSDGSGAPPQQLTHLGTEVLAEHPAVAPGGRAIAFIARAPGPISATLPLSITTLSVIGADGAGLRELWRPARGWLALPAWAPDGRSLYVGHSELRSDPQAPVSDWLFEIVRVDAATGGRRVALTDARDPAFAPGGARLAYLRYDRGGAAFGLHVAAPDGSGDREVISAGTFSSLFAPRFAPDGGRIIFAAIGGPVTDEQGYPLRSRGRSPLAGLLGLLAPAVAEAHGAPWDIWVVNADGTGLRRLPQAREDAPMAVFSPDGQQIVMIGAGGIYLIDADGGRLRRIDPLGDHGGLDWAAR